MATAWDERPAWGATEQREPLCSPELSSRKAKLVSSSGGGREGREPERHPAEQLWVLSVRAGHQNSSQNHPKAAPPSDGEGSAECSQLGLRQLWCRSGEGFHGEAAQHGEDGATPPSLALAAHPQCHAVRTLSAPSSIGDCLALLTFPLQPAEGQQLSSSRELGETPAGSRSSNPNLNPGRT